MRVRIGVTDGRDRHEDLLSLHRWLRDEDALRGRVTLDQPSPGREDMGAVADALVVAVGAGGTVTALASSVAVWLQQRHSDVTIEVSGPERTVTLDAKRVDDPQALLRQVLDHPGAEEE